MLILAHIGIGLLLGSLLYLPLMAVLIGSVAPDIVDKLLFSAGAVPCGRFFAHGIFFGPIAAGVTLLITRRKDVSIAVLFGCYIHLLLDTRYLLPWFYPLVQYDFYCPPLAIRPDLIDTVLEGTGAVMIPIALVLNPKIKYLKKLLENRGKSK